MWWVLSCRFLAESTRTEVASRTKHSFQAYREALAVSKLIPKIEHVLFRVLKKHKLVKVIAIIALLLLGTIGSNVLDLLTLRVIFNYTVDLVYKESLCVL